MHFKKSSFVKLCLALSLLIACTSNENKKTDNPVVKNDDTTAMKLTDTSTVAKKTEITQEKISSASLDGAWEIVRAEGKSVKSNLGTVYTFDGDKLTMGKNGFNNPGKTEITESTFSFENDATKGYKFMYDYKFNGDTLVVVVQNSNGQTFYMVKK